MSDEKLLPEHQQTWKGFVRLITWCTALVVVTLLLMALFLL